MKKHIKLILFAPIFLLYNCYPSGDKFIGKVEIEGIDNVHFNIYQEYPHDLEPDLAITYEIVKNEKIISSKHFLFGYTDFPITLDKFGSGMEDSIIYMTFWEDNSVAVIFDLKTNQDI